MSSPLQWTSLVVFGIAFMSLVIAVTNAMYNRSVLNHWKGSVINIYGNKDSENLDPMKKYGNAENALRSYGVVIRVPLSVSLTEIMTPKFEEVATITCPPLVASSRSMASSLVKYGKNISCLILRATRSAKELREDVSYQRVRYIVLANILHRVRITSEEEDAMIANNIATVDVRDIVSLVLGEDRNMSIVDGDRQSCVAKSLWAIDMDMMNSDGLMPVLKGRQKDDVVAHIWAYTNYDSVIAQDVVEREAYL